jgi:shikimate kinase
MGMKHTGKSTLGALLSRITGLRWYDTDNVLAELAGKTARELYDAGGSSLMMRWETAACRKLSETTQPRSIIATGGGLADNAEALNLLKENGICFYINTDFDTLFARIMESARQDGRLPRFLQGDDPEKLFREIFTRRTQTYVTMADVIIDAGMRTPQDLTKEILEYI